MRLREHAYCCRTSCIAGTGCGSACAHLHELYVLAVPVVEVVCHVGCRVGAQSASQPACSQQVMRRLQASSSRP